MADKYVATTGHDDTGDGTIGNPWQTISKGVTSISAGDTLYFRVGSYVAGSNFINCVSGTSGARVTIKAYPGESVTFTGGDAVTPTVYCNANRHYITIDGFIIDGGDAATNCIKIHNGNHDWIVQNCELTRSLHSVCLTADKASGSGSNSFINCVIHDGGTDTQLDHGIYCHCDGEVIDHCLIYNIPHGYGIQIYQESASNSTISNNLIHDCSSAGIVLGTGSGHLAYNNIIYNCSGGIHVKFGSGTNCTIANNTIYNSAYYCLMAENTGCNATTLFVNNIVYTSSSIGLITFANVAGAVVWSHNLCSGTADDWRDDSGIAVSTLNKIGDIDGPYDPLFINAANHDFRILSNSPCHNGGVDESGLGFSTDYAGVSRGAAWDIGAYEVTETSSIRLAYRLS